MQGSGVLDDDVFSVAKAPALPSAHPPADSECAHEKDPENECA
jgi:hypothetical protein